MVTYILVFTIKAANNMTQIEPKTIETPMSQARSVSSVLSVVVVVLVQLRRYKVWFRKDDLSRAKNSILLNVLKMRTINSKVLQYGMIPPLNLSFANWFVFFRIYKMTSNDSLCADQLSTFIRITSNIFYITRKIKTVFKYTSNLQINRK